MCSLAMKSRGTCSLFEPEHETEREKEINSEDVKNVYCISLCIHIY